MRGGVESGAPSRRALPLLAGAQLLIALDHNIVYVALPSVRAGLALSDAAAPWVVTAYALAFGGLLLPGGRAVDVAGPARAFRAGLALFGAGALACGAAADGITLAAARGLQGAGAAVLFPATVALLNLLFVPGAPRARALAAWGAAGATGGAVGSVVGGALTELLGWRAIFLVDVPVVAAMLTASRSVMPAAGLGRTAACGRADRPAGVAALRRAATAPALATLAVGLLSASLLQAPAWGWHAPGTLALAGSGAVAVGAFVANERRGRGRVLPAGLLGRPGYAAAVVAAFTFMAGFGSQFYVLTTTLQDVGGDGPARAGLAFLPLTLAILAGTRVGAELVRRLPARQALAAGLAVGIAGLAVLGAALRSPYRPAALVADGLGQGITWTAMWTLAGARVPAAEQGMAAGVASAAQQLGGALGLALVAAAVEGANRGGGGLQVGPWAAAALLVPGLLVAVRRERRSISAMTAVREATRRRLDSLALANVAFVVAVVLHGTDHVRQSRGVGALTTEVLVGGTVIAIAAFATLPLTLRHHPRAPLAAAVVGLWTAVGVSASHLAPHWSAFSDPYPSLSLDAYSWTVMLAEIAAALVFGLIGIKELRASRAR